jgi:hypothetical protein
MGVLLFCFRPAAGDVRRVGSLLEELRLIGRTLSLRAGGEDGDVIRGRPLGPPDEPHAQGNDQQCHRDAGGVPHQQVIQPVQPGEQIPNPPHELLDHGVIQHIQAHQHQRPADDAVPLGQELREALGVQVRHAEEVGVLVLRALHPLAAEVVAVKKGVKPQRQQEYRQSSDLQEDGNGQHAAEHNGLGDAPLHKSLVHLPAPGDAGEDKE